MSRGPHQRGEHGVEIRPTYLAALALPGTTGCCQPGPVRAGSRGPGGAEGDTHAPVRYGVAVDSDAARRLRLAVDLFEAGRDLMLQNFRRKYPKETEAQILQRLGEWLRGSARAYQGRPYCFRHMAP